MILVMAAMAGSLAAASEFGAPSSRFDPRAHRTFSGPPTQIMILGSPHLAQITSFDTSTLRPLLDRLAAFRPQIIAIEAVDGPQCEMLRRYEPLHPNAAKSYCPDPAHAGALAGLDVAGATIAAEKMLADWPAAPTAAQRRRLALTFIAAGDSPSAVVQWLRLPSAQRIAADGFDDRLAKFLTTVSASTNENYAIGAALAARLGLERVHLVDDHSADNVADADPEYGRNIMRIWEAQRKSSKLTPLEGRVTAALASPRTALEAYRISNSPERAMASFESDFGAALADRQSKVFYGRQYAAWWETRNLRMVANIRAVTALHPGARVLAIVGSSHRGYYESYLGLMHDVRLVDPRPLLN